MGKLTVTFNGICTHFPAGALTGLDAKLAEGAAWRVLLVQGINGQMYVSTLPNVGAQAVPPHDASMILGGSRIAATLGTMSGLRQIAPASFLLRGVRITVENTDPTKTQGLLKLMPSADEFKTTIPSLQKYAQPEGSPPANLTLSQRMVGGDISAAYFDIASGELWAEYLGDKKDLVARARYEVDTIGPPRLNVKTFYDDSPTVIAFADENPSIIIQNTGEQKDTWYDFTLHYLVCSEIPSTIVPPGSTHVDGLGSGCSNSQWP